MKHSGGNFTYKNYTYYVEYCPAEIIDDEQCGESFIINVYDNDRGSIVSAMDISADIIYSTLFRYIMNENVDKLSKNLFTSEAVQDQLFKLIADCRNAKID